MTKTIQVRFKVRPTIGHLAHVKLQRRVFWRFWETVDTMIPLSREDDSLEDLIEWAKAELLHQYTQRLKRQSYWGHYELPNLEEV